MNFEWYIWNYYGYRPDELEITNVPGVWRVIEGCPGGGDCKHAFRIAGLVCDGKKELTVSYTEWGKRDKRGRFVSPYREWRRQRAALRALEGESE